MVSKASEDLPEPLRPVITVRLLRGISTSMFLRLCWRAPWTEICFSIGKPERGRTDIYCRVIRGGGAMDGNAVCLLISRSWRTGKAKLKELAARGLLEDPAK